MIGIAIGIEIGTAIEIAIDDGTITTTGVV
jgi:hypothetical protein